MIVYIIGLVNGPTTLDEIFSLHIFAALVFDFKRFGPRKENEFKSHVRKVLRSFTFNLKMFEVIRVGERKREIDEYL